MPTHVRYYFKITTMKMRIQTMTNGYPSNKRSCAVEGCEKPLKQREYCKMHYTRLYRTGSLDLIAKTIPQFIEQSGGYLLEHAPDHPLTRKGKRVYAHRKAMYDARGAGPFPCHWCGASVTWDDLHVDHLDEDKHNNNPNNLVPSCPSCNKKRGYHKQVEKIRARGVQITAFGQTMCRSEWAREVGLTASSLRSRILSGWTIEKALSEPRGNTGPKRRPAIAAIMGPIPKA
jgi:hypothetical protein